MSDTTTSAEDRCRSVLMGLAAGVKIGYDAANVMDYRKVDPLPDIRKCANDVRSFCIKDHRLSPRDEDCGPGFGEIDRHRLLSPVAFTGRAIPLCCENIFAPVVRRPARPAGIDALVKRAREFLEVVIAACRHRNKKHVRGCLVRCPWGETLREATSATQEEGHALELFKTNLDRPRPLGRLVLWAADPSGL